jgi:hypothetical protein
MASQIKQIPRHDNVGQDGSGEIGLRKANFANLDHKTQELVLQKVKVLGSRFPRVYALFLKIAAKLSRNNKDERQQQYEAFLQENPYLKDAARWLVENMYRPNESQIDTFYQANMNTLDYHNYLSIVDAKNGPADNSVVDMPIDDLTNLLEAINTELSNEG